MLSLLLFGGVIEVVVLLLWLMVLVSLVLVVLLVCVVEFVDGDLIMGKRVSLVTEESTPDLL